MNNYLSNKLTIFPSECLYIKLPICIYLSIQLSLYLSIKQSLSTYLSPGMIPFVLLVVLNTTIYLAVKRLRSRIVENRHVRFNNNTSGYVVDSNMRLYNKFVVILLEIFFLQNCKFYMLILMLVKVKLGTKIPQIYAR